MQESQLEPGCESLGFPKSSINLEPELENLYKRLECPVCHEFPQKGLTYSCKENQHIICEKCLPENRICPACLGPIPQEKTSQAEKCLNFTIPCKHKFEGCPEVIQGDSVREHIKNCPFRPISCIMSKCTEIVAFKKLFDHLKTDHAKKVNGVQDSNVHVVEWWIEGDVDSTARWPPFYFTCFDNVFLYMCVSTVHGIWGWVWILGGEKESQRFVVETKMENADIGIQWKGPVHPIRRSITEIINSGKVFISNSKEITNPFLFKKGDNDKSYWRTQVKIHQVTSPLPASIPYISTKDPLKTYLSVSKDSWAYVVKDQPHDSVAPVQSQSISQNPASTMKTLSETPGVTLPSQANLTSARTQKLATVESKPTVDLQSESFKKSSPKVDETLQPSDAILNSRTTADLSSGIEQKSPQRSTDQQTLPTVTNDKNLEKLDPQTNETDLGQNVLSKAETTTDPTPSNNTEESSKTVPLPTNNAADEQTQGPLPANEAPKDSELPSELDNVEEKLPVKMDTEKEQSISQPGENFAPNNIDANVEQTTPDLNDAEYETVIAPQIEQTSEKWPRTSSEPKDSKDNK